MEQTLIDIVKNWVTLDNQIRAMAKKSKELRTAKKAQNELMIKVMKENNIDNFDLKDGQIRYKRDTQRAIDTKDTHQNLIKTSEFRDRTSKTFESVYFRWEKSHRERCHYKKSGRKLDLNT